MVKRIVMTSFVLLGLSIALGYADVLNQAANSSLELPPQAVLIEPGSFANLPGDFPFRTNVSNQFFNPTNATPPVFQVFDRAFLDVLGANASITEIAHNATFAFAHEAPVYFPGTDEVFFASNDGGLLGMSDLNHNNKIFKISLAAAEKAIEESGGAVVNVPITEVPLDDSVQMTNGGTGPFRGNIILINSGRGPRPPNVVLVNPHPPNNVTVLLNNYYGRQFNSLNDIKVHPGSGKLFFTDVIYGFINHFRDAPLLPSQVYRLDPDTGAVRVVAGDFDKPNGLAFSGDGHTAYVSDTGAAGGSQTEPATLYAFDVDPKTHAFTNRRILAYVDTGIPDGIQVDTRGNVYTACGDGVHVFAPDGTLLGKFYTGMLGAQMVFAPPNRLVILSETKVFLAKVAAKGVVMWSQSPTLYLESVYIGLMLTMTTGAAQRVLIATKGVSTSLSLTTQTQALTGLYLWDDRQLCSFIVHPCRHPESQGARVPVPQISELLKFHFALDAHHVRGSWRKNPASLHNIFLALGLVETDKMTKFVFELFAVLLGLPCGILCATSADNGTKANTQTVVIDPRSFAVLPQDYPFRNDSFNQFFNPTNASTPIFQVFNSAFHDVIGRNPSIYEIASNDSYAFAHEAPVYIPETDEVFFASNGGGHLGMSGIDQNNKVWKISLKDAEKLIQESGQGAVVNTPITEVPLDERIQMTNGGTGLYKGNIIFSNSGRASLPPSIALVNPKPPYNSTVILNNYYGRQFNSLNDIRIHPGSGKIFFVDDTYGYLNQFRIAPTMRQTQIYRFDPETSAVRVVADGFVEANGLTFSGDGKTAFVTDTGAAGGPTLGVDYKGPATIYAFDVDEETGAFLNRRVFAYIDTGIPDGIQVDTEGNLYAGCGDGIQVLSPKGDLIGKIFLNRLSANLVFAAPNRLVMLSETKVYMAHIAAKGVL
ncbi:Gluconolactonase [Leucoagaricus sp. SymC.cos]|nr:Gluconolactonase [Leucoagaricus sp. SymC.cos]